MEIVDAEAGTCRCAVRDISMDSRTAGESSKGVRFAFGRVAVDAGIAATAVWSAGLKVVNFERGCRS